MTDIVYNYSIVTIPDEDDNKNIAYDVICFNKFSTKMDVIRIRNVYLSFMLCKLPGITIKQTLEYVKLAAKTIGNFFIFRIVNDYKDASYNILYQRPCEYVEILSKSPYYLRELYLKIYNDLEKDYYKHLRYKDLDEFDKIFINETETPFRFTEYTTNPSLCKYYISQRFDLPFVGFMKIKREKMDIYNGDHFRPLAYKVEHVYILNASTGNEINNNINNVLEKYEPPDDYDTGELDKIVVASYDIETYNKNELPNPRNVKHYIFCLGVGLLHLRDPKPFKRFCIISKDMFTDVEIKDRLEPINGGYIVRHEYTDNDDNDYTTYYCVSNEKELLTKYVDILTKHCPHINSGFNNFAFDDVAVISRVNYYNDKTLTKKFYNVFSIYDIDTIRGTLVEPKQRKFELKIEGSVKQQDNETIRAPVIESVDVYKMILKMDAKRFSQSGKLDAMLKSYNIVNPYNNQPLSKTGLTINEMFDNWDKSTKLYEIAKYCCQDAWIAGTLLVERGVLIDKLMYASITYTTFEDSIYRADGHRVSSLRTAYAYKYKFALMNTTYENRGSDDKCLGFKKLDTRTIVGGAVRVDHAGRTCFVTALDFHAQYPSTWITNNLDPSCRINPMMLEHPERYGLQIVKKQEINDMYGVRNVYYIKRV